MIKQYMMDKILSGKLMDLCDSYYFILLGQRFSELRKMQSFLPS